MRYLEMLSGHINNNRTMNNTPTPKIIQLLMSPNDSVWQGVLLGLGDDGATYHCQGDTWQPYIPPLNLRDKEKELAAVTEQRDQYKAALQSADNHNHEIATKLEIVTEQRDRLAEALNRISEYQGVDDEDPKTMAIEALQSLNQPTP